MRLDSVQHKRSPNPARTQPEPIQKPAQSQLKASTALNRLSADRYSLLLRHEPGFALSGLRRGFRKTRFQSLFSAGPRTVFCRRPHPGNSVYFAPDLIAAKPVKPCDRGVFWALNLLLILKQANGKAGGGSAQPNPAQPKPEPKLVFAGLPIRWVRVTNRACLARLAAHLPQSRVFRGLLRVESQTVFAAVRFLKRAVMSLWL